MLIFSIAWTLLFFVIKYTSKTLFFNVIILVLVLRCIYSYFTSNSLLRPHDTSHHEYVSILIHPRLKSIILVSKAMLLNWIKQLFLKLVINQIIFYWTIFTVDRFIYLTCCKNFRRLPSRRNLKIFLQVGHIFNWEKKIGIGYRALRYYIFMTMKSLIYWHFLILSHKNLKKRNSLDEFLLAASSVLYLFCPLSFCMVIEHASPKGVCHQCNNLQKILSL